MSKLPTSSLMINDYLPCILSLVF